MSPEKDKSGDRARVTVTVALEPAVAWEVFTQEIDRWWRHGPRFRLAGRALGRVTLEAHEGGRLFELVDHPEGPRLFELARVTVWQPPSRLVLCWRGSLVERDETTEVEVLFQACTTGTRVTLEHRGWNAVPADHPARHGQDDARFLRALGLWWADQLGALRELTTEQQT